MASKLTKKLKSPEYMMNIHEFMVTANREMPDELIKFILSWNKIKKSPYNNKSYYNEPKGWDFFKDGGIRVSDHWNFSTRGQIHCKTKQVVEENGWSVGIYDSENDIYNIINTYPVVKEHEFSEELKNLFYKKLRNK